MTKTRALFVWVLMLCFLGCSTFSIPPVRVDEHSLAVTLTTDKACADAVVATIEAWAHSQSLYPTGSTENTYVSRFCVLQDKEMYFDIFYAYSSSRKKAEIHVGLVSPGVLTHGVRARIWQQYEGQMLYDNLRVAAKTCSSPASP